MRPDSWQAAGPQAAIAVGEVRHARSRPRAHAFRYPSYFLRLPMRRLAAALAGHRFLSHNRFNLLSFDDRDHGDGRAPTLAGWIDGLLASQGIVDADGEIWLHAFPRVLGYAFKPVSFWFCERADGRLRAVVCEVNNTFGERHCYLLAHPDGRPIVDGESMTATKVFHVSPFCSVTGGYRFRFAHRRDRVVSRVEYHDDATNPSVGVSGSIDSSGSIGSGAPLLTTSVSGSLVPLDDRAVLSAFFRFPLFTFGVVARIHWHAFRLFLKRAPFFSKPMPPTAEVSR